jgi:phage terminase Nu1 subunit (DNA packaging protein)
MGEIRNGKGIAAVFEVSPRAVSGWRADGLPVYQDAGRGKPTLYDTARVHEWLLSRDSVGRGDPELSEARKRIVMAEARKRELRVALEEGQAVSVQDAVRILENVISVVRARILSMANKIAPEIVSVNSLAEVKKIVDGFAFDLLREIAAIDPEKMEEKKK